jgi:formylglycine-generating enzyme required for sulfatase activity
MIRTLLQALRTTLGVLGFAACVAVQTKAAPTNFIANITGGQSLTIESQVNWTNRIEYATNLSQAHWTVLTNLVVTTSPYLFVDAGATSAPQRFYRFLASPYVNKPPTLAALPDTTINEDSGLQTVNLSGISAGGGESQTLTVAATSDNPALIPLPAVTYTSPSATGTLAFTPATNAYGSAVISVVVNDHGGTANGGVEAVTNTFKVTVNPVNDAPTLATIPDTTINENAGLQTVNLSGISAGGGESQTLTVTATSDNPALIPNLTANLSVTYTSPSATGTLAFTPATNAYGSAVISVVVNDHGGTANGGVEAVTNTFKVTVLQVLILAPNMASINDTNSFLMGDANGTAGGLPIHQVNVSPFLMDSNLVTYTLWTNVYHWATNANLGYSFTNAGSAKLTTSNNPVQTVSWYDVVKWCNARSEKDGLEPCYYIDTNWTTVYRTGTNNLPSGCVKWSANGYRLPTEAEWEKAARGKLVGLRFPWGDTISQLLANFQSYAKTPFYPPYDLSTAQWNPIGQAGGSPGTSPVGSFLRNGYGLSDMTGNLEEWCWDRYSSTYYSTYATNAWPANPLGPVSGTSRVTRGGSWSDLVLSCLCGARTSVLPKTANNVIGFRCARGTAQ